MRLLLVEDEADLARAIARALREEGFVVDIAEDGEDGAFQALEVDYDGIVLDLMLPKMDGLAVLAKLRKKKKTPVLILTARDATADKVKGLDGGADDYLTKPFELEELIARVRALVRRGAGEPAPRLEIGAVLIDTASRSVTRNGKPVELAAKEYAILELLALRRGALVTRAMIWERVWGDEEDTASNVVDVYVSNLRRKLGKDLIVTRRGMGYVLAG